jgi:multiple sugar transport system permease protein
MTVLNTEIRSRASAVARQTGARWVAFGAIAIGVVYTLFPVWWMVSNSLKNRLDVFAMPPIWIVTNPSFVNYTQNFSEFRYAQYIFNSAIVALVTTVFSVAVGAMAGYALARFRYPRNMGFHLSFWILSTRMIPPIVTIVPLFIFFHFVGLVNTKTSLIIAYTTFNLPFVVWMMKGYFREIPRELEESAMVDGDTGFGAFWRIVLPLARPGLAATAIFCMILSWNELLFAVILTETASSNTLPMGIAARITQFRIQWGEISAISIVALMPALIVAFILQKHLVRGLSFGAGRV